MDFDLKEIAWTLAVGAFVIAGVEAMIFFMLGKTVYKKLQIGDHMHPWGVNAIVIGLAIIAGLVCDGVSKAGMWKFRVGQHGVTESIQKLFLPSEDELRMSKLLHELPSPGGSQTRNWQVTWLCQELFRAGAFDGNKSAAMPSVRAALVTSEQRTGADQWVVHTYPDLPSPNAQQVADWTAEGTTVAQRALEQATLGVFYHGHNLLYIDGKANAELDPYEKRLNFGRSLAFASLWLLVVAVLLGAWALVRGWRNGAAANNAQQNAGYPLHPFAVLRRVGISTAFFFTVYLCARTTYYYEHDAYDIRIYGYLSTMLQNPTRGDVASFP